MYVGILNPIIIARPPRLLYTAYSFHRALQSVATVPLHQTYVATHTYIPTYMYIRNGQCNREYCSKSKVIFMVQIAGSKETCMATLPQK